MVRLKEDAFAVLRDAFAGVPIFQFRFPSFFRKESVLSKVETTRQDQTLNCSIDSQFNFVANLIVLLLRLAFDYEASHVVHLMRLSHNRFEDGDLVLSLIQLDGARLIAVTVSSSFKIKFTCHHDVKPIHLSVYLLGDTPSFGHLQYSGFRH